MLSYLIKRILLFFPTLLGIIFVTFVIIQFVPGGPVEQMIMSRMGTEGGEIRGHLSESANKLLRTGVDEEQIKQLKSLYGFDKPLVERFFLWCKKLFTFQFGDSYFFHKSVLDLVKERLPVSVSLGVISFFLTYLICIPLGVMKAVKDGTAFDIISSFFVLLGYSVPGFVLGVFLIVLFGGGSFWDVFPIRGLVSDNFHTLGPWDKLVDYLKHLCLPIICMTIGSFAVLTNLTKNTVIENIRQQYVLTARSKGLSENVVIWKHTFRNSMIPLVTGFAGSFLTVFFGSSLLIETIFSLDGLGLLSYQAVIKRDYPIVMANLYFFSLLYVFGNLLSDLMYVLVDPRISFNSNKSG